MAIPADHEIPSHQQGTSWSYEFDFADLGEAYLEGLAQAQFWTRSGSETGPLGLNLSLDGSGASESGVTVEGTILRIFPAAPISLAPGHHFWGVRLSWENGRVSDPLEGRWIITRSGAPELTP